MCVSPPLLQELAFVMSDTTQVPWCWLGLLSHDSLSKAREWEGVAGRSGWSREPGVSTGVTVSHQALGSVWPQPRRGQHHAGQTGLTGRQARH